jgi:hypothetical protein
MEEELLPFDAVMRALSLLSDAGIYPKEFVLTVGDYAKVRASWNCICPDACNHPIGLQDKDGKQIFLVRQEVT